MNFEYDHSSDQYVAVLVLAVPTLIILAVIVPLLLFFLLRRNRDKLNSVNVIMSYGLLFKE